MAAVACSAKDAGPEVDPSRVVDELLEADRSYAAAAAGTNVIDGIAAFLATNVWMPAAGTFYSGRASALEYLRANADNLAGHLEWAPVRGGVSADGQHGFTFGFMTLVRPDSPSVPLKYLAYWVNGADGWKAVAYKRARRAAGAGSTVMVPPSLPPQLVPVNTDSAAAARYEQALGDAERAFSDLAGEIGLGPAFQRNAAPDAMNMGGPQDAGFVYGPEAIGSAVGAGREGPSALSWGSDHVIVASSGDLGVSIGHIVIPGDAGAPSRRVPFFTIWRRDSPAAPWRFVAE